MQVQQVIDSRFAKSALPFMDSLDCRLYIMLNFWGVNTRFRVRVGTCNAALRRRRRRRQLPDNLLDNAQTAAPALVVGKIFRCRSGSVRGFGALMSVCRLYTDVLFRFETESVMASISVTQRPVAI